MKFTCIMTTFNDGELIEQSIRSILNQTYENFELIIVDDGSEQGTKDILSNIHDYRMRVLPQSNDGLSSARNRAIHHADGDYVCFLDADDTRAPWAFAEVAQEIRETQAELVMVQGMLSRPEGTLQPFMDEALVNHIKELDESANLEKLKEIAISFEPQSANKYISREIIERGNLRFPNDHFFEDILFHSLVVSHAKSIAFINTPNFTYFNRLMRPQLTGSNGQIRFDILGTARLTFDIFQNHELFSNSKIRGALTISVLRLLQWCEGELPTYHKFHYRQALRILLSSLHPLYREIDLETINARGDRDLLIKYMREVLK